MAGFKKYLQLTTFCIISLQSIGQDSVRLSEEYFRMGMEVFDYQHRKQASELFILAAQTNPKNANAHFMAGQSIMLSLRKERSLPYYKKAYSLNPKIDNHILFHLGQAYHYSEQFDSAIYYYNRYNQYLTQSSESDKAKRISEVNRRIFECNNAKVLMAHPLNVVITHLDDKINSEYPDYAPGINALEDYLIFTTRRPEGNTNLQVATDHEYYEDIFYSKKENGDWTPAKNMIGPLNTNYHNASINLSPDGKEMLLYHDTNGGDIFTAFIMPDGTWGEPKSMVDINTPFNENSATISADGNTIYFTSNRPGGIGGMDIYESKKDSKGRWSNIKNMGSIINTELEEDAVFISANGQHLYFSSNGHAGMGDLDIYRSTYNAEKKEWGKPINMGYPINSVENDIYFVLAGDEGVAYFSSVRNESLGEEDIYKADISKWKPLEFTEQGYSDSVMSQSNPVVTNEVKTTIPSSVILNLFIAEQTTHDPVSATLTLTNSKSNFPFNKINEGTYQTELTSIEPDSRFQLQVANSDYIPYNSSDYLTGINLSSAIYDTIYLNKIAINFKQNLNVLFGINSDTPTTFEDIQYLEQFMKSSPTVKVEISGHTDNTGEPGYNLTLSKKRSEAIKKYLVDSGIDASRITTMGYGAEKPVADNSKREGRKLNRRTEFTIIEK